jgi:myosin heavy subunit
LQEDIHEEEVEMQRLQFYDNKSTMDELMNKPHGVLYLLDEANKMHRDADFVIGK